MKAMKRKLLSLLLAMAMVLSLVPTALASGAGDGDGDGDGNQQPSDSVTLTGVSITGTTTGQSVNGSYTLTASPTPSTATGTINYTWSVVSGDISVTNNGVVTCQDTTSVSNVTGKVKCSASQNNGEPVTDEVEVTFTGIPAQQDPVATKIGLPTASTATVSIAANADSTTATAYVLDQNGEQMSGAIKVERTSGATATASVTGNTINIQREGTAAGNTVFTVSAANDTTVQTATLTVSVEAKPSISTATIAVGSGSTVAAGNTITAMVTAVTPTLASGAYDTISWRSSNSNVLTVTGTTDTATVRGVAAGKATVTVEYKKGSTIVASGTSGEITVTGSAFAITTSVYSYDSNYDPTTRIFSSLGSYAYASFTGGPDSSSLSNYNISWTSSNTSAVEVQNQSNSTALLRSVGRGNATITVTLTPKTGNTGLQTYTTSTTVTVSYSYDLNPSVTVYRQEEYNLNDTDTKNVRSIVRQLSDSTVGSYYNAYVTFTDITTTGGYLTAQANYSYYIGSIPSGMSNYRVGLLSDIDFIPDSSSNVTKAEFRFTLTTTNAVGTANQSYSGLMTFNISGDASSAGDINYTASIGDDVSFNLKDFEDFYYSKTRGTLSYVSFTLPSGGSLYSDRGRLTTSNACYASPTGTQADLGGVYFTPSGTTATRANTVRISFTAYGSRYNNGTTGTVVITYLAGTAKDITYNISTSGTLKASDFTDAYKAVVGSTAPTGLTIQFQTVPTYGTLTYKDSSRTTSSTVTLRSSNIKSYNFTTRSTGSNQLADVTYTASGTRSDTIEYIAYVNSTPQFTGKVVFNGSNASASNMQVSFTSTGGQSVAFSYNAFVTANATAMASTSYIRFVTMPTGGTLTYNGAAMSLTSTNVLPALLGSVVYRPNSGYNNSTDRISFVCYDANGNSVGGGQVSIIVTGNTSSSSGANTVNQFKDVTATAWYRNDLITLVNAGIIQGRGDGKFDPTAELTYGEALKIFMLASGYPAQAEASGKDWAINYKNLAVSNGWITSDIDLSAKISRNAMAELAAKSLGVSPSSSVPPTWNDGTSNSYANALYYTSPQILIGNADGTFKGTSTLLRQEICAIASRVLSYKANQQSMEKPGWIG